MMEIFYTSVISIICAIIIWYIIDKIQNYYIKKELMQKIQKIAGKGSDILYSINNHAIIFKIENIDDKGILIKNKLAQVYIPVNKLLNNEIIIPTEYYNNEIREIEIESNKNFSDVLNKTLLPFTSIIDGFDKTDK